MANQQEEQPAWGERRGTRHAPTTAKENVVGLPTSRRSLIVGGVPLVTRKRLGNKKRGGRKKDKKRGGQAGTRWGKKKKKKKGRQKKGSITG